MSKLNDNQLSSASGGKLDPEKKAEFEELATEIMQDLDKLKPEQKTELEKYLKKISKKSKK